MALIEQILVCEKCNEILEFVKCEKVSNEREEQECAECGTKLIWYNKNKN